MTPDVRVVAVVKGQNYKTMASATSPRASSVLGIPVLTDYLPEGENVWEHKLSLLKYATKPVLCIDVDLIFVDWDWSLIQPDKFNAVLDYPLPKWRHGTREIEKHYPVSSAVNGGLWYAPPTDAVRDMFRRAVELHPEMSTFKYCFGDQAPLNRAIHETGLPVHFLPHSFNHQVFPNDPKKLPPGTHVGHAIGNSFNVDGVKANPGEKVSRVLEMLRMNPKVLRR